MKLYKYLLLFISSTAWGYSDHDSWSNSRSYYLNSYQFTSGMQALQSTMSVVDPETGTSSNVGYRGLGIKSSLGTEVNRFVRFSLFTSYQDLSANPTNSLRGGSVGGDIKLSFAGPVFNVNFGLGVFGSSLTNQHGEVSNKYWGQGVLGSVEVEKFLSPGSSVVFGVEGQQQTLRPELTSVSTRPQIQTLAASLGIVLWLQGTRY